MERTNKNPGAGGAGVSSDCSTEQQNIRKVARNVTWLEVNWLPGEHPHCFCDGQAQTLYASMLATAAGLTNGEVSWIGWARRISAFVFKLRKRLEISTTRAVVQPDARVGRYKLATPILVFARSGLNSGGRHAGV